MPKLVFAIFYDLVIFRPASALYSLVKGMMISSFMNVKKLFYDSHALYITQLLFNFLEKNSRFDKKKSVLPIIRSGFKGGGADLAKVPPFK